MSWIYNNKRFLRIALLFLFILSLFGPWVFDLLSVPAQYPCGKPTVRLDTDFCGYPMLGFQGLLSLVNDWFSGNFSWRWQEFIAVLYVLIVIFPFFSTVVSIWKKDTRRWQTINLAACGVACIPTLHYIFLLSQSGNQLLHTWGIWLYIATALGTVLFGILLLKNEHQINSKQ